MDEAGTLAAAATELISYFPSVALLREALPDVRRLPAALGARTQGSRQQAPSSNGPDCGLS